MGIFRVWISARSAQAADQLASPTRGEYRPKQDGVSLRITQRWIRSGVQQRFGTSRTVSLSRKVQRCPPVVVLQIWIGTVSQEARHGLEVPF